MGFKREDIRDTSPLSLKKLNDTLRYLWLHSFGNIDFADLSENAQGIINNKVGNTDFQTYIDENNQALATKVSNSEFSSKLQQSATDIKIGFNDINNVIEMTANGLKVNSPDGNYSMLEAVGIRKYVSGTAKDYHYLTYIASCTTTGNTSSPVWITLPSEFQGKQWSAYPSIYDSYNSGGTSRAVQKLIGYTYDQDYANNRVGLVGYTNEVDVNTGAITQGGIALRIIIIA